MVDTKTDCSTTGLVYQIKCNQCDTTVDVDEDTENTYEETTPASYLGMSSTSAHCRMVSHKDLQKGKNMRGPLARHDRDKHNGQAMNYTTTVIKKEKKLLNLCITEALYIEKYPDKSNLNERMEMGRGGLVRLQATRIT